MRWESRKSVKSWKSVPRVFWLDDEGGSWEQVDERVSDRSLTVPRAEI